MESSNLWKMVSDLQSSQSGLYSNHMTKALTHLLGLSCTVRMDSFDEFNSRIGPNSIEETPVQFWTKPEQCNMSNKFSFDEGIITRECTVSIIECTLQKQFKLHCFSYWSVYFSSATLQTNKHRPLRLPVLGGEPRPPRDAKVNFTWAGNFFLMPCSRFEKYVWCVKSTEKSPRDLQEVTGKVSKKNLPVRFGRTGLI